MLSGYRYPKCKVLRFRGFPETRMRAWSERGRMENDLGVPQVLFPVG